MAYPSLLSNIFLLYSASGGNRIYWFSFFYLIFLFLLFICAYNVWVISPTFIGFLTLDKAYIPGINPSWSCFILVLIDC
jgi:hypothetical protein